MSDPLFAEERRRVILDELKQRGRVSVKALSERFKVSAVTIRQDLRTLEAVDLLDRTYGGAVLPSSEQAASELSFDLRQHRDPPAKRAIAMAAVEHIHEGDSIALDASTTAFAMVPLLKQFEKLIIVTNSLMVAHSFLDSPQIQVLMPGGWLRRDSIALVGRPETLPDVNVNVGFFGTRGITLEHGVTDSDPNEVAIKQAMIKLCLSVVVVADHHKWDHVAPYTFADCATLDAIVTSAGAPPAMVEAFRALGVEVTVLPLE